MTERLTVGSLFSGIGGLDLGLERAGMQVIWQSEIEPYCCRILKKHWPEVVNHGNIKQIDWSNIEKPDIICGGYPCQPFSTAGKRRGEQDERHLWPWVRECISELRPRYAILENVRGHLSMGGTTVIGELASIGYDAEWRVVSAASVGANHRRDRIIIVAYPSQLFSNGSDDNTRDGSRPQTFPELGDSSGSQDLAYTDSIGLEGQRAQQSASRTSRSSQDKDGSMAYTDSTSREYEHDGSVQQSNVGGLSNDATRDGDRTSNDSGVQAEQDVSYTNSRRQQECEPEGQPVLGFSSTGQSVPDTDSRQDGGWDGSLQQGAGTVFGGADNGRGTQEYAGWEWWETEPDVGRVAHGIPSRVDRLRGLGNAVVPQVAEVIGRLVVNHHERNNK